MNKTSARFMTVILTIILMSMLFLSCASSLTDTLHSFSPNKTADVKLDKSGLRFQSKAGIRQENGQKGKLGELKINKEFLETYVEEYGLFDLLDHYNGYLSCAIDEANLDLSGIDTTTDTTDYVNEINDRDDQIRNEILALPQYQDLDTILIDDEELEKFHGKSGYYGGMEDEIIKGDTVSGDFNDPNHDNEVYEDSVTNRSEKKYYGDWEVDFTIDYDYDPGKYGWNNGVFEDELSHFTYSSTVDIFYKGGLFASFKDIFPEDVRIECKLIDDKLFHWQSRLDKPGYFIIWADGYTPGEDTAGKKIDDDAVCASLAGNRYAAEVVVSDDGTTAEYYLDFYSDGTCEYDNGKDEPEKKAYEVRAIGVNEYAIDTANLGHEDVLFFKDEYRFKVTGIEGDKITEFTEDTFAGEWIYKLYEGEKKPVKKDEENISEDEEDISEDEEDTGGSEGGGVSASGTIDPSLWD